MEAVRSVAGGAGVCGMVAGQAADLESEGDETAGADRLQYIHARKTGAIIKAAALAGAHIANADARQLHAISEFGSLYGLLFQITDDILDVEGDFTAMGKTLGKDKDCLLYTSGMLACLDRSQIRGIGVSSRPRPEADSYMPVFLAGRMAAASLGAGLGLTPYHTSHQQGHVRAAMLGNEALLEQLPILGMHISGGTTEIFTVDAGLSIRLLGGTEDLHAGQLVDRLGVAMGLPFPAGAHLEAVARAAGDTNICLLYTSRCV